VQQQQPLSLWYTLRSPRLRSIEDGYGALKKIRGQINQQQSNILAKPIQRTSAPNLFELVDGLPLIFRRTIFYTPSYILDDLTATAVEHVLAALGPPARSPATIERLHRWPPREPEYPFGPQLEDGITAPEQLVFPRGRLRIKNDW